MNVKCLRCGGRLFEVMEFHASFLDYAQFIKERYCLNCGDRPGNEERLREIEKKAKSVFEAQLFLKK